MLKVTFPNHNDGSVQTLVQSHHPDAFEYDDEDWVFIKNRKTVTETCVCCGQPVTRDANIHHMQTFGSGGSSEVAWHEAAKNLGLI